MKNVKTLFAILLCLCTVLVITGCGGGDSIKLTKVDMSLEDAVKQAEDAGCIPAVVTVYDEANEDGAVLSTGEFMKDAKEGDAVTIVVNDLTLKDKVAALPLAPRVITQDSYEKNIYEKLSSDEDATKTLDANYTLISLDEASERELETLKNTYPIVEDTAIYVLDTGITNKELGKIEEFLKTTDYTHESMFNDYMEVGIVPTPSSLLTAEVLTADNCEFEAEGDGVAITLYKGKAQNVVVPAELDGKPVVKLAEGAIPQITVHGITTNSGLTDIAAKAVPNAYGLLDIALSDTVMDIGMNAFTNALFTDNTDGYVVLDGDYLVAYEGDATEITVPEDIRFIGAEAFLENETITKVTLPEGLLSVGESAFKDCANVESYNIPSTTLKICDNAFYRIRKNTVIDIPASVLEIGNGAFFENNEVSTITIGENVKEIGDEAFVYAFHVSSIDIPASVEYIGNGAFMKCHKLTTVTGGAGLKFAGSQIFEEDPYYDLLNGQYCYLSGGILIKAEVPEDGNVVLPAEVTCLSAPYLSNLTKKIKTVTINDGCTAITKGTFADANAITEVTIPASVTYIDDAAFNKGNINMVIKCEAGSAAEEYAKENHFKYETK